MKQGSDINSQVENAMNSLDGMQKADAPAHLYTRIRTSLSREENGWKGIASFLSKPAVALCFSIIMLTANAWIIYSNYGPGAEENNDQLTALAQEYHFEQPSFLDQNNNLLP